MPKSLRKVTTAAGAALALALCAPIVAQNVRTGSPETETIICTALEVHANAQPGTTIAIIHQQSKPDQARFASLLARADGGSVQIQAKDGAWVTATIVRLRSCFGRGLLLFPSGGLKLTDRDVIHVKFSALPLHS